MKKTYLNLIALFAVVQFSYAQTNTFPSSGNVGIGTTSPTYPLTLSASGETGMLTNVNGTNIYISHGGWGLGAGKFGIGNGYTPTLFVNAMANGGTSVGNVGIGTTAPQTKFHVYGSGTSTNSTAQYSGNAIIEAGTGGRSSTAGASLEFVIPANTDGSNPWGQARIIAVAGNTASYNATGKMVLGTRRMFDKGTGTGVTWNYGDDIVIDGVGNVGVNTSDTKGYKFAVNGSAIATSMKVKLNASWPDFVFLKDYKLPTLTEVKNYIDKNQHLPDIPSAGEVHANGLDLGEMNRLLLKKVEELTLYLIEKDDNEKQLKEEFVQMKKLQEARIKALETALGKLTATK